MAAVQTFLDPVYNSMFGRGSTRRANVNPNAYAPPEVGGTRLKSVQRRNPFTPVNLPVSGGGGGGGGRSTPRSESIPSSPDRKPTFLNSDAYFSARGSGLDWLQKYGPNRQGTRPSGPGQSTYGGRTASAAGSVGSGIGGSISDSAFGGLATDNPYTALTGDSVGAPAQPQNSNSVRYNQMGAEADMLLAQGLEEGKAAVDQTKAFQNTPNPPSQGSIIPLVDGNGPGSTLRSPYGSGGYSVLGGGPRSFGPTRAPSVAQSVQDDIGDRAIASRNRAGVSTSSLLDSYARRMARQR